MMSLSAGAQNWGNLLGQVANAAVGDNTKASGIINSLSEVVYAYTGNTTAVSLPGNWAYEGSAIALGGGNALSNVAGTAATGTIEGKIDEYLAKVGIVKGALSFSFAEDLTFTCTVKGIPVSGTWRMIDDGKRLQLQFGKNMKFLSMTGDLKGTLNGCEMLFDGKKFLSFVKTILSYVNKQGGVSGTVASLADNYSDMQIGFELSKVR